MYVIVIKHVIFCKEDSGAAAEFLLYQRIFISVSGLENVVELIFSRLITQILSSNTIMTGFLRADIPLIGVVISLELTPEHFGIDRLTSN